MVYLLHTQNRGRMTKDQAKHTEQVQGMIVDGYRRGVCDHNGKTLAGPKRGMAGKGSHFRPPLTRQFRDNYALIDWSR